MFADLCGLSWTHMTEFGQCKWEDWILKNKAAKGLPRFLVCAGLSFLGAFQGTQAQAEVRPRGSAKTDVTSEAVNSKCHFQIYFQISADFVWFLMHNSGCTSFRWANGLLWRWWNLLGSTGWMVVSSLFFQTIINQIQYSSYSSKMLAFVCVCVPDSDSAQGSKTARHASVVESLKNPVEISEVARGTRGTHQTHWPSTRSTPSERDLCDCDLDMTTVGIAFAVRTGLLMKVTQQPVKPLQTCWMKKWTSRASQSQLARTYVWWIVDVECLKMLEACLRRAADRLCFTMSQSWPKQQIMAHVNKVKTVSETIDDFYKAWVWIVWFLL